MVKRSAIPSTPTAQDQAPKKKRIKKKIKRTRAECLAIKKTLLERHRVLKKKLHEAEEGKNAVEVFFDKEHLNTQKALSEVEEQLDDINNAMNDSQALLD